jgi:hypothetical protein
MDETKSISLLRTLLVLAGVCLAGLPVRAQYSGGTGEPNDPYQIATAADLIALGETPDDYDKHFLLTADIDLDPNLPGRKVFDRAVIPPETPFAGAFNGAGHTISHLTITGAGGLALFGKLDSTGRVSELSLAAAKVSGTGLCVGALAAWNGGTITHCSSTGTISGGPFVGGLVGYGSQGRISFCSSAAVVNGEQWVGGLVGFNSGSVAASYARGSVSGEQYVGGLVGATAGIVATSYSSSSAHGTSYVGGLIGAGNPLDVRACVWDVETSGQSGSAGGVGLTSVEMMDAQMLGLNGWAEDPNWVLDAGRDYPRLAWEGTPGSMISEPALDMLEGEGTAESPYRIDTADQLILLGKAGVLWDRHFVLGADIDLDPVLPGRSVFGQAVVPIFRGVFDGQGHITSNLTIEGGSFLGLFGILTPGAEVSNVAAVNVHVTGAGSSVGGLVGDNSGSIVVSCSAGSVTGEWYVGGLVGFNGGCLAECCSSGTRHGSRRVGGLVGTNGGSGYQREQRSGGIRDCYATGVVDGNDLVGGLAGNNDRRSNIVSSYSSSLVRGDTHVGGLVGDGYDANDVSLSFWDIEISGQGTSAGGTGKSTAAMQTIGTFLAAGWDFVGGTNNGTEDIWWIEEGEDYPRLWWQRDVDE